MKNQSMGMEKHTALNNQKRGIRITVSVLLVFILAVLAGFMHKLGQPRVISDTELRINGTVKLQRPRVIDNIELLSDDSKPFHTENFQGRWTLVFFGFTHCPDICPTTLSTLNTFYKTLDRNTKENTDVVLVSVDPGRDNPEQLSHYVRYFNQEFRGITGDFFKLKRFATQLNVPFNKVTLEDGGYTIDHGSQVVLINPRGHYHAFFKAPLDPAKMKLTYRSIRATFKG
ncbi:SCO family protein [Microbulbifer sp. OS29]|uniref:SCO family protein n=1 Tax=Microbulbifer okhotskensis TaxID=2926617 RepID=A0A9X2J3H6_9GAMM|nr:SCO family protein [Microbulbifer okhotskensis]MCO1333043.1 SCO family protein [Microbulbifer okhotskensis]